MSKNFFIGVNNAAEKVKNIFVGVNGAARKVKKILAGDANNIAQLVYEIGTGTLVSIPTMTSNTTPSGTASASSIQGSSYPAYYAFDKRTIVDNTKYRWTSQLYGSESGTYRRWVAYDFGYLIRPISAYVYNYCSNNNAWAFVIEGSADGSTWDILVDCSSNTSQVDTTYQINTNSYYQHFRYRCTNGANTYRAGVWEFDITGYKS